MKRQNGLSPRRSLGVSKSRAALKLQAYGRKTILKGAHGQFAMCKGSVAPSVVKWLMSCQTLKAALSSRKKFEKAFYVGKHSKGAKQKHLYKSRVAGNSYTRNGRKMSSLNGMSTRAHCGPHVAAFVAALLDINRAALEKLDRAMKNSLRKLPKDIGRNRNVEKLVRGHVADWIFTTCTVQAMGVGPREPDYWHGDGGGSLIAIWFGIAGSRGLKFKAESAKDSVKEYSIRNACIYITNPGAFLHQVIHDENGDKDSTTIMIRGMGRCKVAFQLRCDTFTHNRGTIFPASPHMAWKAASAVVAKGLTSERLKLPTLQECQDQLSKNL